MISRTIRKAVLTGLDPLGPSLCFDYFLFSINQARSKMSLMSKMSVLDEQLMIITNNSNESERKNIENQ